jgi:hypothetical protein
VIEFVAGLCFVAAALFAVLWWRARMSAERVGIDCDTAERSRAGMAALLATVPAAGFRWRRDGGEMPLGQLPGGDAGLSYDRFLAGLAREDAARIDAAIDELRRVGAPFSATVSAPDGAAYDIDGSATASGDSVIWITDVSAVRRAEAARAVAPPNRPACGKSWKPCRCRCGGATAGCGLSIATPLSPPQSTSRATQC